MELLRAPRLIDGDIEDDATRCVEVKNWIEKLVIPSRG